MTGEHKPEEDETRQNLGWLWGMGLGVLIAAGIWFGLMSQRPSPPGQAGLTLPVLAADTGSGRA